jgi:predicted esterase
MLISVFILSVFAGAKFAGKVSAAEYTEYSGILDGADFVARFPEPWNGMLVVFCRFYWPFLISAADALEFQSVAVSGLLSQGFAVATSSYASTELCIQKGMNCSYNLTLHIIDTYNITGKVFLWGVSMGGAIALLLGEKYPQVYSGVIDVCGIKDLKEQYAVTTNKTMYEVETGGTPTSHPKAYEDLSPTYHANITIPIITIHGTEDTSVPFHTSIMYQNAIASAGHSDLYRLYNITGEGHLSSVLVAQVPSRCAELEEWSNIIPEGLSVGVLMLLSSISVIVSMRYFRKRSRRESCSSGKIVETRSI